MDGKPTKLKDLHVTSVSFVDEGANPEAHIMFSKRRTPAPDPEGKVDPAPAADPAETKPEGKENLFKRFVTWLKGEGMTEEEVRKEATSFADQMYAASMDQIDDEIWNVIYALRSSMSSILTDATLDADKKASAMKESVNQFGSAIGPYIDKWCNGKSSKTEKIEEPDSTDVAMMCGDQDRLDKLIKRATGKDTTPKGELEDMLKIDKSKMSPDELKAYEEIVKKYAVDDGITDPTPVPDDVAKGKNDSAPAQDTTPVESEVVKALKAQIEETNAQLKKMKEAAETKEFSAVAKKYCDPLGKKEDELIATLKKMKDAGDDIYDSYVASLDQQLELQKQSGVFTEIGKSGSGSATGDAEQRWIAKAKELQAKKPTMTLEQAMDEVALTDDELRAEIDQ